MTMTMVVPLSEIECGVDEHVVALANEFVDVAVTSDVSSDVDVADYVITHDGHHQARVFRNGDLILCVIAQ